MCPNFKTNNGFRNLCLHHSSQRQKLQQENNKKKIEIAWGDLRRFIPNFAFK